MRHIRDAIDEIAAKRQAMMSPEQRAVVDGCLLSAAKYCRNEISLELAMTQTMSGFVRAQVSMSLASSDPRRPDWLVFTEAVYQERIAAEGMPTKHGFMAFSDVGLHTRSRITYDPGRGRVIEFQVPTKGGLWCWPSEMKAEERQGFGREGPSEDEIRRYRAQWDNPTPPPPPKDDEDEIIFDEDI